MRLLLFVLLATAPMPVLAGDPLEHPRLQELDLPGPRRLDDVARDILAVRVAMSPDLASAAGLFDDAGIVPSYAPKSVAALTRRLEKDLRALAALDTRSWSMDERIDLRWMYASALDARRKLVVEKLYRHRPGEWLEPVSNNLLNLLTYAPERADLRMKVIRQIPAMLAEMRVEVTEPTARDVEIALGLLDGLALMVKQEAAGPAPEAAISALAVARAAYAGLRDLPEFRVIGEQNYAWRLRHALLLPWTPDELLALANRELAAVDAEIAVLEPTLEALPEPTPEEQAAAAALDQQGLLRLYDQVVERYLEKLRALDILTIPEGVGPIRARPTPEAMIPLTGDGGSMNPPAIFAAANVGWWNVEHVGADWSAEDRLKTVVAFHHPELSGLGTYAVHEGVPGHHLQLSIARLNPDPMRSVLMDNVAAEGWGLYAEQLFWEAGGFGPTARARYNMLRSWRFRIRRVIYDVNIETGRWTLQQAADWKANAAPGEGRMDPDLLRSINWPTQLIAYFSGKMQILAMREELRAKQGASWDSRAFHDALLATGSIPNVFVRAKLLGGELPALEAEGEW